MSEGVKNRRWGGRVVSGVAGVGAIATIVLACAFGEQFLTSYYLYRLRRGSDDVVAIIKGPRGSAQKSALLAFAKTAKGRRALLSVAIAECERLLLDRTTSRNRSIVDVKKALVGLNSLEPRGVFDRYWLTLIFEQGDRVSASNFLFQYPGIGECLEELSNTSTKFSNFPDFCVRIVPLVEAVRDYNESPPENSHEYAWSIERCTGS